MSQSSMIINGIFSEVDKKMSMILGYRYHLTPYVIEDNNYLDFVVKQLECLKKIKSK